VLGAEGPKFRPHKRKGPIKMVTGRSWNCSRYGEDRWGALLLEKWLPNVTGDRTESNIQYIGAGFTWSKLSACIMMTIRLVLRYHTVCLCF
jgi:hypothetical protein